MYLKFKDVNNPLKIYPFKDDDIWMDLDTKLSQTQF